MREIYRKILRLAVIATAFAATLFASTMPGHAEKRVALVIGNSGYRNVAELRNPRNDSADMAAVLRKLGFRVIEGSDLDKAGMDRIVRNFSEALVGADVGLFFYAGHGLQVAGNNYLVPVDATLSSASGLDFEMIRLDLVQRQMEREAKTNVLLLDACRDNPLARNLARSLGTRSGDVSKGLANAESGVGTLIAFSTQPGNVALDGEGRNSPFSAALVRHITTPGRDLNGLLIAVRNDVRASTAGRQVPWENSALTGQFYFSEPQQAGNQPTPQQSRPFDEAAQMWSVTQNSTSIAVLQDFIRQYGSTNYGSLARARLAELEKLQVAALPPAVRAAPDPPAGTFSTIKGSELWVSWNPRGDATARQVIARLRSLGAKVLEDRKEGNESWNHDLDHSPQHTAFARELAAATKDIYSFNLKKSDGRSIPSLWITPR